MKIRVYADAAATTRLSQTALEKAFPYLRDSFGNASSRHSLGNAAKRALGEARATVAEAIGAEPEEIVFTSGASETNAWVLSMFGGGIASFDVKRVKDEETKGKPARLVTSAIEHPSIRRACDAAAEQGARVEYLPVDGDGAVSLDALKTTLETSERDPVNIATIMFANNEIGTIQPISEAGALLRRFGVPFHTDAAQAVGRVPIDVKTLNVDFLTASAHKFNGPKGVGFLYCRHGVAIRPMIRGGLQERGLRAGTENVFGAVATACALAENVASLSETAARTRRVTAEIVERLRTLLPAGTFRVVCEKARRLPGTLCIVFKGVVGESIVQLLDLKGVCASTGSACSSGKTEPSPVLTALGFSPEDAKSAVRLSFDRDNLASDAAVVAETLAFAYRKITNFNEKRRG